MTMLRFADIDSPCMGDVYDGMDTIVEKVKLSIQTHENDPTKYEALCNKVEAIIHHRWEKMTTPLHLLVYALSPRYYSQGILAMPDRVAPYVDEEVANGCYKEFARLFQDDEIQKGEARIWLICFRIKTYSICNKDQNDMGAITWWYMYGQPYKHLQPLAIKILSQVASSFVSERNWSTHSYIHSVKHNRLGSKKVEDLVYIHTNLCLLSRKEDEYKEGSAKLWDVVLKCANLDATFQDLTTIADDDDDDSIMALGASSTSGTIFGSNDLKLAAVGDDENVDLLENP